MLNVPIFLYQLMFVLFSSAIPVLIILYIVTLLGRSMKKTINTVRK